MDMLASNVEDLAIPYLQEFARQDFLQFPQVSDEVIRRRIVKDPYSVKMRMGSVIGDRVVEALYSADIAVFGLQAADRVRVREAPICVV